MHFNEKVQGKSVWGCFNSLGASYSISFNFGQIFTKLLGLSHEAFKLKNYNEKSQNISISGCFNSLGTSWRVLEDPLCGIAKQSLYYNTLEALFLIMNVSPQFIENKEIPTMFWKKNQRSKKSRKWHIHKKEQGFKYLISA